MVSDARYICGTQAERHVSTVLTNSTKPIHPSYQKPTSICLEYNALSRFAKDLHRLRGPCTRLL